MPTQHSRVHARLMISPAVLLLLGWMLIPLGLTVYFSLLRYNLLMPGMEQWTGLTNYPKSRSWFRVRSRKSLVG